MAKKTIGRYDRADFPELGMKGLRVKVDTGAYTSSLHATAIHERMYRGSKHLYFRLLDPEHPKYLAKSHRIASFSRKEVKSSSGIKELRYFIETVITLFDENYPLVVSLADRSTMRAPVLLGRSLIRNNFIVDVTRSNLSLKNQVKKKKTGSK